ncbi:type II secretion system F family protein [Granulicella sp. WH15]|uniref:type II secretion system F family protein n=1 Tax=Granulicella sp. WH15 TaxID=2602070 RepID=UPI001366DF27|nr:type II secretion system F family protein [Granulicella sp. WH15]QHN02694.1 type II secretion system F family protein [Granulicella sp. WH15]
MGTSILYAAIGLTLFCVLILMMAPIVLRPTAEAQRFIEVVQSSRPDRRKIGRRQRFEEGLVSLIGKLRSKLGIAASQKSQERLQSAGLRSTYAQDLFFAAQVLTPLVGVFVGSFVREQTLFAVLASAVVGYVFPNICLDTAIRSRRQKIARSLPDAVDLLVICINAGLGLDQALLRIGEELAISHPEIQGELSRVYLEQRAGRPRIEAWQNLATRTKIKEVSVFVSMLMQTDRFGTPIGKALSEFSEDLRQRRRQRAEEAAAKAKVKIIFPLVFFIFPCLFIVLLAPAFLSIMNGFQGMSR